VSGQARGLRIAKRVLIGAIGVAGLVYLAFLVWMYVEQRSMLFPGAQTRAALRPPSAPGLEVLKLSTSAGEIEALYLPPTVAIGPAPTVIYAHGNGEITDYWVQGLNGFRDRGIGVLLVEYPGYGRSGGAPSEASIRIAMDAAYDRLVEDPRVDKERVFGFGRSLGGGAICLLARDRPLRALVLESTFPSLSIFAARYWVPAFLLRDHFDNIGTLRQFKGPVLVIHGREDELIPWHEGQRLAAASPHASFKLYECGHGCWDPDRLPFWRDADQFLGEAGIVPRPASVAPDQ
jgi:uncharacterized protein